MKIAGIFYSLFQKRLTIGQILNEQKIVSFFANSTVATAYRESYRCSTWRPPRNKEKGNKQVLGVNDDGGGRFLIDILVGRGFN